MSSTVRITFTFSDTGNKIIAIKAMRDVIPGLGLKESKEALENGVFECPKEYAIAMAKTLTGFCTDVRYPKDDRGVAEARLNAALGKLEDRIMTRWSNFLADVIEKV